MMGDALASFDPGRPRRGSRFRDGSRRTSSSSMGTWVRVGPLRQRFLAHFGDLTPGGDCR